MGPPASHKISRVSRYSGTYSLSSPSPTRLSLSLVSLSSNFGSTIVTYRMPSTPDDRSPPVWPLPFSLATTKEIEFSFFSSGYLDVSLPRVPLMQLLIHYMMSELSLGRVSPFGYPRITAYLRLPEAFRSLSRPSSAISALASTLRSFSLDRLMLPPLLRRLLRFALLVSVVLNFLRSLRLRIPHRCY